MIQGKTTRYYDKRENLFKALCQSTLHKHFIKALYTSTLSKHFIQALYQGISKAIQKYPSRYYQGITTRYYEVLYTSTLSRYLQEHVTNTTYQTSLYKLICRGEVLRSITCYVLELLDRWTRVDAGWAGNKIKKSATTMNNHCLFHVLLRFCCLAHRKISITPLQKDPKQQELRIREGFFSGNVWSRTLCEGFFYGLVWIQDPMEASFDQGL